MKKGYTVSILNDYSRLDEIYRLTHDTFVLSGEIVPQDNSMISTCPHLDSHSNTIVVIAEQEGKIIGTITATIDSEMGLNMDKWFDKEIAEHRTSDSDKLGAAWRLATAPAFRGSRRLIIDLITTAIECLIESGCTLCFFALMSKHTRFYRRLMDAQIIRTKDVSFDEAIPMELNLMKINLGNHWKRNKFTRLKIVGYE